MEAPIRVLGVAGSLRAASLNAALLRAAAELAPATMTVTIASLAEIPLYNGDVEAAGTPEAVLAWQAAIAAADALLIVTPEYNSSVPGVLKNAIDWASRPPRGTPAPLSGKPVAVMGASPGILGTARAQTHLRSILGHLNMAVLNKPEVIVGQAPSRFDAEMNLIDTDTRARVAALLEALDTWTRRLRAAT